LSYTKGHINFPEYFISTTHMYLYQSTMVVLICTGNTTVLTLSKLIFFWKSSELETQSPCVCVCFRNRGECSFQLQLRKPVRAASREWELGPNVGGIWLQDTGGHRSNNYMHISILRILLDVQLTNTHCAPACGLPSRPPTQPNHDISDDFGYST